MVYSAQMVGFSETSCFRNRLKAVYLVANADSYFIFKIYLKKRIKAGSFHLKSLWIFCSTITHLPQIFLRLEVRPFIMTAVKF